MTLRRKPSRGIALFTVLAVLALGMVLLGTMLNKLVDEHRQSRLRHQHRQCRRLTEAGVARGQLMRSQSEDYAGEKWIVAAAELNLPHDAVVTIDTSNASIVATATYPSNATATVRHTRRHSLTIQDNSPSTSQP